jgi:hypothetical protein
MISLFNKRLRGRFVQDVHSNERKLKIQVDGQRDALEKTRYPVRIPWTYACRGAFVTTVNSGELNVVFAGDENVREKNPRWNRHGKR